MTESQQTAAAESEEPRAEREDQGDEATNEVTSDTDTEADLDPDEALIASGEWSEDFDEDATADPDVHEPAPGDADYVEPGVETPTEG